MAKIGEIKRGREIGYPTSASRKYIWGACLGCGKERWVPLYKGMPENPRCRKCIRNLTNQPGKTHSCWRGGRRIDTNGYVQIRLYPDDFFYQMIDRTGYVYEHRLVMAKHLKRCLLPWEVVHHKNGISDDNRLENLMLLPTKKYHLSDMVAKSYIKRLEGKIQQLEKRILLLEAERIVESHIA